MNLLNDTAMNCRIYIALMFAVALASCSETNWDTLAKAAARECGNEKTCMIKLSDVYLFEWSVAYVFDRGTSKNVMEEVVGTKLPNYDNGEFCQRIVFMDKAGRVVSSEFSSCPSDLQLFKSKGGAVAEFLLHKEQKLYFRLTRQESILCASRDDTIYTDRQYYGLMPYQEDQGCGNPHKIQ